jgi:O-glycosyl hydrolase
VSLQLKNGGSRTAVIWQLHQTGEVAKPPVRKGTATSAAGEFKLTLPADSVTTLVMSSLASNQK